MQFIWVWTLNMYRKGRTSMQQAPVFRHLRVSEQRRRSWGGGAEGGGGKHRFAPQIISTTWKIHNI